MEIFLSVGRTSTREQEDFVRAVEDLLRANKMEPRTVGRNSFTSGQPLHHVREVMRRCSGTVIVAFERTYIDRGLDRRGSEDAKPLASAKLPTVWNQIEAGLAYSHEHPLLVIVEKGLKSEGLLEKGYDWFVQWVDIRPDALGGTEFLGVFSDWKDKVDKVKAQKAEASPGPGATGTPGGEATIGQLVSSLRPSQLWSVLGALATVLVGTATLSFQIGRATSGSGISPVPAVTPADAAVSALVQVQTAALEHTGALSPERCSFEQPCRGLRGGANLKIRLTRPGYAAVYLQDSAGRFFNQEGRLIAANVQEGSSPLWPGTDAAVGHAVFQLWVVTSASPLRTVPDSTPLDELPSGTSGQAWGPVYLDTRE